jgi:hypothetical protein
MSPYLGFFVLLIAVAAMAVAIVAYIRRGIPGPVGGLGPTGTAGSAGPNGLDGTGLSSFSAYFYNPDAFDAVDTYVLLPQTGYIDTNFFANTNPVYIKVLRDGVYQVQVTARGKYYPQIGPGLWSISLYHTFLGLPVIAWVGGYGETGIQTGIDTCSGQWTGELLAEDEIFLVVKLTGLDVDNVVHFMPLDGVNTGPSAELTINYLHDILPLPEPLLQGSLTIDTEVVPKQSSSLDPSIIKVVK